MPERDPTPERRAAAFIDGDHDAPCECTSDELASKGACLAAAIRSAELAAARRARMACWMRATDIARPMREKALEHLQSGMSHLAAHEDHIADGAEAVRDALDALTDEELLRGGA